MLSMKMQNRSARSVERKLQAEDSRRRFNEASTEQRNIDRFEAALSKKLAHV